MKNGYKTLISDLHEKIKEIRRDAQILIADAQKGALAQTEQDFEALGWTKYWTADQLNAAVQFERLEQSVTDAGLRFIEVDISS